MKSRRISSEIREEARDRTQSRGGKPNERNSKKSCGGGEKHKTRIASMPAQLGNGPAVCFREQAGCRSRLDGAFISAQRLLLRLRQLESSCDACDDDDDDDAQQSRHKHAHSAPLLPHA
ncbi:hypothetical protein QQF64_024318 [Cirrhinus molitorella]|uniref:Uncharacterized protein n=1 Tax=Cirrhinus molitorella TaxID=172907 RepID=A0ABR3NM34_9TELE